MKKMLAIIAVAVAIAAGAVSVAPSAQAHSCTYHCDYVIHPWTGNQVWCGLSVAWNRIWLPWGYWECHIVWHYGGDTHWQWDFWEYL